MKLQQLSQPILVKLLDLDERVATWTQAADLAEDRLEHARLIVNGHDTSLSSDEYSKVRDSFNDMLNTARAARVKANTQQRVLSNVKVFVDRLPPNTRLLPVYSNGNGADLAAIRSEMTSLQQELRRLQGNPPPDPDIGRRVDDLVASWVRSAAPLVRGFATGQTLDVRWPTEGSADRTSGSGFASSKANALFMVAALFPAQLAELVLQTITTAQPLSQLEHAERIQLLTERIVELSYVEAAIIEKNGGEFHIETPPCCVLGVRLESEGDAAI
jgi:hypothetical protein